MVALKRAVFEVVALGVLGLALGFATNSLRGSGSIHPLKNYFSRASAQAQRNDTIPADPPGDASDPDHADHPYQTISFPEVVEVFNDPDTALGVNVFVDARNDGAYEAGHIPGAIQCDHYRLAEYIDEVLTAAEVADRVIVYCNGGECEDSIFTCTDLQDAGVAYDVIYLYAGGWEEWEANQQPVAIGRGE